MSINKLKLNKEKTEFLLIHLKFRLQQCLPSICFGQDIVQPSQTARNAVTFDSTMSMLPHIKTVCKSAFYHLCNLSHIRKFISMETFKTLRYVRKCTQISISVTKCPLALLPNFNITHVSEYRQFMSQSVPQMLLVKTGLKNG